MSTRASVAALGAVACAVLVACADLTKPHPTAAGGAADTAVASVTAEPPSPNQPAAPPPAAHPAAAQTIRASHILIAYKGASGAGPNITRTKAQAFQRAQKVLRLALHGGNFAQLARQYSDGPSGKQGGDLGAFTRSKMVKAFADAAFQLKPGQISSVVETQFGYHIIKRTQ